MGLRKSVSCSFFVNLTTKCKTNLKTYFRNNLEEIYLRNLQDTLFNIIRRKYQAEYLLFARIINTAIITIKTIKTITIAIISYFL